jgi:hypothetical protein
MKIHFATLEWVVRAMDQGRINKNEFDILFYATCKLDWSTMRVPAYSAGQVCRFYGLDADNANRKRFSRAKDDLASRKVVRDDYRHCQPGNERTYTLFLPKGDPFATENRDSLFVEGMSQPTVSTNVRTDVSTDDAARADGRKTSRQSAEKMSQRVSQPVSQPNRGSMSITTQENQKTTEKDTLHPPDRGLLPLPSPSGRDAQVPQGFVDHNQNLRSGKSLTPEQAERLNFLVREFRVEWAKYHNGFDPKAEDTSKLLKHHSPLEVLVAYRNIVFATINNKLGNRAAARFFGEGAENAIVVNRRAENNLTIVNDTNDIELREFYALDEQWRELFNLGASVVFQITSGDAPKRFYHPQLRSLLNRWKAQNEAEERHQEANRKAEEAAAEAKRKTEGAAAETERKAKEAEARQRELVAERVRLAEEKRQQEAAREEAERKENETSAWRQRALDFLKSDRCTTLGSIETWLGENPRDEQILSLDELFADDNQFADYIRHSSTSSDRNTRLRIDYENWLKDRAVRGRRKYWPPAEISLFGGDPFAKHYSEWVRNHPGDIRLDSGTAQIQNAVAVHTK